MLLETLDIKTNDIIIYSRNIPDLENNFKIIYKDDPEKLSRSISFDDVCGYINENTPKNLIVYRLLTNLKALEVTKSKYGYFVYINGVAELVYFDPIFAIKEVESFAVQLSKGDLRFIIQQVGLTSLNRLGNFTNYAEIYQTSLEASEANTQDDSVFAEALLVKSLIDTKEITPEPAPVKEEKKIKRMQIIKPAPAEEIAKKEDDIPFYKREVKVDSPKVNVQSTTKIEPPVRKSDIAEDNKYDYRKITKMDFGGKKLSISDLIKKNTILQKEESEPAKPKIPDNILKKNEEFLRQQEERKHSIKNEQKATETKVELPEFDTHDNEPKETIEKPRSAFSDFINKKKTGQFEEISKPEIQRGRLLDIFKSSESLKNYIQDEDEPPTVLKLK